MGVLRGYTSGNSVNSAQPIYAGTQDGDTVVMVAFRPASANVTAPSPAFDFNSHYVASTNGVGVRVSRMTWNTGDATSYSAANGTLGYVFLTFAGATTIGAVQNSEGTTGAAAVPSVTLTDADGSSRIFGVVVHRDASAVDTPDGMTELTEFAPASNAIFSLVATPNGVTSFAGDASVPVTDAAGTTGWRSVVFEVSDSAVPIPSGSGTGTYTFTGAGTGKRDPKGSGTGTFSFTGTAVGDAPDVGTAEGSGTGTWGFTGSASGKRTPIAAGSGTFAFTGTGTGKRVATSSGSGSWSFTGAATGQRTPKGAGTGTWSFLGSGVGDAPEVDQQTGSGTGSWGFTGAGVGKRFPKAVGTGTWSFSGLGVGRRAPKGLGTGTWTFTGIGSGEPTEIFVERDLIFSLLPNRIVAVRVDQEQFLVERLPARYTVSSSNAERFSVSVLPSRFSVRRVS